MTLELQLLHDGSWAARVPFLITVYADTIHDAVQDALFAAAQLRGFYENPDHITVTNLPAKGWLE